MEENEHPVEFYDFLYRDRERLVSYYAQIFKGKLLSTEHTSSQKEIKDQSGKLSLPAVGGDMHSSKEWQRTGKQVVDPHDTVIIDVLAYFREHGMLHSDIENAPPGSIILAHGILNLADGSVLQLIANNADASALGFKKGSTEANNFLFAAKIISKLTLPTAFLLSTLPSTLTGTLNPENLQEPVSSYYFKQGSSGLADVYLIGIKDNILPIDSASSQGLFGMTQQFADIVSALVLPQNAIRILPLAMFRVIHDKTP